MGRDNLGFRLKAVKKGLEGNKNRGVILVMIGVDNLVRMIQLLRNKKIENGYSCIYIKFCVPLHSNRLHETPIPVLVY